MAVTQLVLEILQDGIVQEELLHLHLLALINVETVIELQEKYVMTKMQWLQVEKLAANQIAQGRCLGITVLQEALLQKTFVLKNVLMVIQLIQKHVMTGLTRLGMCSKEETDAMKLAQLKQAGTVRIGIQPLLLIQRNQFVLLYVGTGIQLESRNVMTKTNLQLQETDVTKIVLETTATGIAKPKLIGTKLQSVLEIVETGIKSQMDSKRHVMTGTTMLGMGAALIVWQSKLDIHAQKERSFMLGSHGDEQFVRLLVETQRWQGLNHVTTEEQDAMLHVQGPSQVTLVQGGQTQQQQFAQQLVETEISMDQKHVTMEEQQQETDAAQLVQLKQDGPAQEDQQQHLMYVLQFVDQALQICLKLVMTALMMALDVLQVVQE